MKLDYGSGHNPRKGYKTSDITGAPFLDYTINPYTYRVNCPNNTFDEILVRNVFHHITQPNNLLKELKRILTRDGKVVIVEPTEEAYPANVALDKLWYRYIIPRPEIYICEQYRDITKVVHKFFHIAAVKYYDEKQTVVLRSIK